MKWNEVIRNSLNILRVDEIVEYRKPREEKVSRTNGWAILCVTKWLTKVDEGHIFFHSSLFGDTTSNYYWNVGREERHVKQSIRNKRIRQGEIREYTEILRKGGSWMGWFIMEGFINKIRLKQRLFCSV